MSVTLSLSCDMFTIRTEEYEFESKFEFEL